MHEGYEDLDPSHPLGGPDGGKDAICQRLGAKWIMAVYFPRGEQDLTKTRAKFKADLNGVFNNDAVGIAFVTNQELTLAERREMAASAAPAKVELYHLERITNILDKPEMAQVRRQFLKIESDGLSQAAYEQRLKALSNIWSGWVDFCNQAPACLGILNVVTYEEQKHLNRNPKIRPLLSIRNRETIAWMQQLEVVEKERPILGEALWRLFFIARAIIGRIVFLLEREADKSEMMPWQDDPGIKDYLNQFFTPVELNAIVMRKPGALHSLRTALDVKLLEAIKQAREATSFGS